MKSASVAVSLDESCAGLSCLLVDASDALQVGGKAFNLARLMALGAPVPNGDVLTRASFEAFLANPHAAITLIEPEGHDESLEVLHERAEQMSAVIMAAPFPAEVDATLRRFADRYLTSGAVAVRSSAIGEDGDCASFAGQFDSVLGVTTLEGLRDAVRRCYASYWSARASFYRRTRGIRAAGMAVVIQRQVEPTAAGVLFTRHPDPSEDARHTLAIEYCAGLADGLVAGRLEPGGLVVSRLTRSIVSEKQPEAPQDIRARATVLRCAPELARLALSVEQGLGAPQDIEWAIDATNRVWLVQSRPITTAAKTTTPETTAPSSPATDSQALWSNANVSENFPRPISPLLYSIASIGYYNYFRNLGLAFGISRRRLAAMDQPLRAVIGVQGARMYYNLTNIHAVLGMAPFGDRLATAFNTFVGAGEIASPPAGAVTWREGRRRVVQWLELLRIAVCTAWQYAFLERRIRRFERTVDAFAARTEPERLSADSLTTLAALMAEFIDIRCRRWTNASLADAAAMVTFALFEQTLTGGGSTRAMCTRLLCALPEMPSSVPPRRLWHLSRMIRGHAELRTLFEQSDARVILSAISTEGRFDDFRRAFDEFLRTWGFRSSAELMLTEPGLDERPEPAIELLKQYASDVGESPEAAMARQAVARRRETSAVLRALARQSPVRAATVWLLLRWTQSSVVFRERARFKQALLYARCRRLALNIGDRLTQRKQLQSRDDVFMLTWSEIAEIASGRAMFPQGVAELVHLRRRQHARQSELTPPDTLRLPEGEAFAAHSTQTHPTDACHDRPLTADAVLKGTTACGGCVTAAAAVLADVSEAARLTRGNVLVTRQTDPGWAPVFCLVSGLVIERGGMLSHGAIIAREFGLPCVVGVKHATTRIPHGAQLRVDGDRGECVVEASS